MRCCTCPGSMSMAPTVPSTMCSEVTDPAARMAVGCGRGLPEALPDGVNTNDPVLPWLSLQAPPKLARSIAVCTWTGAPPGGVTMVKPRVIEPFGFGTATPTTEARTAAPHWLS